VLFPANDAPRWRKGMISIIVLVPVMVILTAITRILQRRDQQRAAEHIDTQSEKNAQEL
jgi:preprotein translocase subunit YajC